METLQILRLSLGDVNWKRVAGIGAAGAFVLLIVYAYLQGVALQKAELVYRNPTKTERRKKIRIQGPVRIVTKTIKTPGREETTTQEVRDAFMEYSESVNSSQPVFAPEVATKWLVGGSKTLFGGWQTNNFAVYGGRSLGRHLDLSLGISGAGKPIGMILWRW